MRRNVASGEVQTNRKNRFEIHEKEHRITHEFRGGYVRHNLIFRKEYDSENTLISVYVILILLWSHPCRFFKQSIKIVQI